MSTVNLYDVLDVDQNCDVSEIKEAYRKLAKKFHPDKPSGDAEMFELIIHAYSVLSNPETRKEYDKLYQLAKKSERGHKDLKEQAKDYFEAQEESVTKKSKKEREKDFKKAFEDMDRKRNYDREREKDKLDPRAFGRMLSDMQLAREQEDIENTHEKIFDDGIFSLEKFNAAFDAIHKGPMEVVPHSGKPQAWNSTDGLDGNFSTLENYDDLFADDEDEPFASKFATTKEPSKSGKLSKEEIKKMKGVDYVKGHKKIDDDFSKMLEERMREREMESKRLNDITFDQFDTDPTCGGYGFLHEIGASDKSSMLTLDDNKDLSKKYQKLLQLRNREI